MRAFRGQGRRAAKPATVVIENFSAAGKSLGKVTVPRVVKTDEEWRKQLPEDSFYVTRHEGTERPYSGKYNDNHADGLYRCICCDTALFDSRHQVRIRHRLAEFLEADLERERQRDRRQQH